MEGSKNGDKNGINPQAFPKFFLETLPMGQKFQTAPYFISTSIFGIARGMVFFPN